MPAGCSKRDLPAWGWCKSQTTEVYQPDTQYSLHPSPYLTLGDQAGEISHTVINRVNNHRHNARHNDQPGSRLRTSGSRLHFSWLKGLCSLSRWMAFCASTCTCVIELVHPRYWTSSTTLIN